MKRHNALDQLGLVVLMAGALLAMTPGCGEEQTCGEGTRAEGDRCVVIPAEGVTCGAGAALVNGECVLDSSGCGAGTELVAGRCVVAETICRTGARFDRGLGRCVPGEGVACGPGTELVGTSCNPTAAACGPGARFEGGACVLDSPDCGATTQLDAVTNLCVPAASACGAGTALAEGRCVAAASACGDRAVFDTARGVCVPEARCQRGDVLLGGLCVPPARAMFAEALAAEVEPNDRAQGDPATPITPDATLRGAIEDVDRDGDGTPEADEDTLTFEGRAGEPLRVSVQTPGDVPLAFVLRGPQSFIRWSAPGAPGAAREVLLPHDGTYTLTINTSARLLEGQPDARLSAPLEWAARIERAALGAARPVDVSQGARVALVPGPLAARHVQAIGLHDGALVGISTELVDIQRVGLYELGLDGRLLSASTLPATTRQATRTTATWVLDHERLLGPQDAVTLRLRPLQDTPVGALRPTSATCPSGPCGQVTLGDLAPGEVRTITFNTTPGAVLELSQTNTSGRALELRLERAAGARLKTWAGQPPDQRVYQIPEIFAGGSFTLVVANTGGATVTDVMVRAALAPVIPIGEVVQGLSLPLELPGPMEADARVFFSLSQPAASIAEVTTDQAIVLEWFDGLGASTLAHSVRAGRRSLSLPTAGQGLLSIGPSGAALPDGASLGLVLHPRVEEVEPNDSFATATPVPLDTLLTMTVPPNTPMPPSNYPDVLSFGLAQDSFVTFSFVPSEGYAAKVQQAINTSGLTPSLHDPAEQVIRTRRNGSYSVASLLPAGTNYVRWAPSNAYDNIRVFGRITASPVTHVEDAQVDNNTRATAQDLGQLTGELVLRGERTTVTDDDYYKIFIPVPLTPSDPRRLRVTFDFLGTTSGLLPDICLHLLDVSGQVVSTFGGSFPDTKTYGDLLPGEYYLRAYDCPSLPSRSDRGYVVVMRLD